MACHACAHPRLHCQPNPHVPTPYSIQRRDPCLERAPRAMRPQGSLPSVHRLANAVEIAERSGEEAEGAHVAQPREEIRQVAAHLAPESCTRRAMSANRAWVQVPAHRALMWRVSRS
eukprot:6906020-Prymnesium_polylepis.2